MIWDFRERIDILEEIGRYLLDRMGCVVGVGEPRIAFGYVDGGWGYNFQIGYLGVWVLIFWIGCVISVLCLYG